MIDPLREYWGIGAYTYLFDDIGVFVGSSMGSGYGDGEERLNNGDGCGNGSSMHSEGDGGWDSTFGEIDGDGYSEFLEGLSR